MARPTRIDSPKAIGERLRLVRLAYRAIHGKSKAMSQVAMCRLTGIGPQAWNNFESGRNRISIDSAIAIARHTGAPLDYLYLGDLRAVIHVLATEIEKLEKLEIRTSSPSTAKI